jgi:hypothetical protein
MLRQHGGAPASPPLSEVELELASPAPLAQSPVVRISNLAHEPGARIGRAAGFERHSVAS